MPAPFTKTELFSALELVMPADLVEMQRNELREWPDEPGTLPIGDDMLLILAAVSESHAARVVSFRPDLREQVAGVRADPAAFLESRRMPSEEENRDSANPEAGE